MTKYKKKHVFGLQVFLGRQAMALWSGHNITRYKAECKEFASAQRTLEKIGLWDSQIGWVKHGIPDKKD